MFYKINFKFSILCIFLFSHVYFITSFSKKLNFITTNISIPIHLIFIAFLITKITTLHQLLFIFILLFFFKIQKNTNFQKFTQNTYFTPTSFLSSQFVHLKSSSHITPHHYPTHHQSPPKILQKTHFSQKFQTTLSYSPLNLILHTCWPSYSHYKYQTTTQERGPKFWENKITIFMKYSKIFISSWNFTIIQPKVHNHFQQTKNTQKPNKNHPKPWI